MELAGIAAQTSRKRWTPCVEWGLEYAHAYPDEPIEDASACWGLPARAGNQPDILLMDEAFSALDPLIRARKCRMSW